MEDEYLVHYGVLGMKWGVRKQRSSAGSSSSRKKKKKSIIQKISKRRKDKKAIAKRQKANEQQNKKSISSMTDSELDKYITRLRKEKTARELKYDRLSSGKKLANEIARDSVKKIGTSAGYQIGMYFAAKVTNKAFGDEVIKTGDKKKKKEDKAA